MLCTNDWEEIYADNVLQSHATEMSDHCPLILGLREGIVGKKRFHFESFWPNWRGFLRQYNSPGMSRLFATAH